MEPPLTEMTYEALKEIVDARSPKPLSQDEVDALMRLITIAKKDSGQCRFCANFLLAWWNAETCGGFNMTDMWAVYRPIADDMVTVIGLLSRLRSYPNTLGFQDDFHDIMRRWRPKLMEQFDSPNDPYVDHDFQ